VQYLVQQLPLRNKFLRSLSFIGLSKPLNETQTLFAATSLPTVIPATSKDALTTELRLFNCTTLPPNLVNGLENHTVPIDEAWKVVNEIQDANGDSRFPLLCQLSAAICTLFHGNADAERAIGKSHDIDASGKRILISG
jgi:hypothetical protein